MFIRLYKASTALQEIDSELESLHSVKVELESLMMREDNNSNFERKLQRVATVRSMGYRLSSISGDFEVLIIPASLHLKGRLSDIMNEITKIIEQLEKIKGVIGKINGINSAGFIMVLVGGNKPKVVILP